MPLEGWLSIFTQPKDPAHEFQVSVEVIGDPTRALSGRLNCGAGREGVPTGQSSIEKIGPGKSGQASLFKHQFYKSQFSVRAYEL
jgi:hypothetical protein